MTLRMGGSAMPPAMKTRILALPVVDGKDVAVGAPEADHIAHFLVRQTRLVTRPVSRKVHSM